jgi:hypothetical protein
MYMPIPPQHTNAQAWLAAASAVQDAGGESYNVVIDIADPAGCNRTGCSDLDDSGQVSA